MPELSRWIKAFEFDPIMNDEWSVNYYLKEIPSRVKPSSVGCNSYISTATSPVGLRGYHYTMRYWCWTLVYRIYKSWRTRLECWFLFHRSSHGCLGIRRRMREIMAYCTKHERCHIRKRWRIGFFVKLQPDSMYSPAFGSANYNVHYYDIRYPAEAMFVSTSHNITSERGGA